MSEVKKGDIITVCYSGVVSCYRILDPDTMLCDLIFIETGKPTGHQCNLAFFADFGLDDGGAVVTHWGSNIPKHKDVIDDHWFFYPKERAELDKYKVNQCQPET